MNAHAAIRSSLDLAEIIVDGYLSDLSDSELLHRPCAGGNHILWQLGHLIGAEHRHLETIRPGCMPPLPEGFAARYTAETAGLDDPAAFHGKSELLSLHAAQRVALLAALEALTEADFDRETGIPYAPTVGALLLLQGTHWVMHAGQWAVIRRQLGRAPLF